MAHRKQGTESVIRKRTPLEQAIAEKTNPRAKYDAKMVRNGFKRSSIWAEEATLDDLKRIAALSRDNPDHVRGAVRQFVLSLESAK